jgi:hypothetical protein
MPTHVAIRRARRQKQVLGFSGGALWFCSSWLLVTSAVVATQAPRWSANPEVVRRTAAAQPSANFEEARVGTYQLPDLLRSAEGTAATREAWLRRRAEILELFREHVYGRPLGRPDSMRFAVVAENPRAMNGAATLKRVAVVSTYRGGEHSFELTLFLPNAPPQPVGLFLLLNNRPASNTDPSRTQIAGFWPAEQVIARGYGIAALQNNELARDDKEHFRDGVLRLYDGRAAGPRPGNAPATLAAWAWGASRAMDYFATDRRIDTRRVAVLGHSRGGKAALWAGAEDERFALVISNESGEGGAALSRRNFGETLERITSTFPHWFAGNYSRFSERVAALPVDQHMLLALIAPRALYVASADEDLWSDPRGEFLSLANASPAFELWGDPPIGPADMPALSQPLVVGRRGYHVRPGPHNLTPYDWDRFADFAAQLWP